jgi:hypothetical protein
MKILTIKEVIAQNDVKMQESQPSSNSSPAPNTPSAPRSFSWINYNVTAAEGGGTDDATNNEGAASVPRQIKWIYQGKAPTGKRLAERGVKSGTISTSVATVPLSVSRLLRKVTSY